MKLLKFIPLLLMLTLLSSNVYAAKDCDEIKGNIVGKFFCKTIDRSGEGNTESKTSTLEKNKKESGWKFWKKPEWMKKKN